MIINQALKGLYLIIRDLLEFDETHMFYGRDNLKINSFKEDFIVVDNLSSSDVLCSSYRYDGANENMTYESIINSPCIVDIYGDNAYQNMYKFINLIPSQKSLELQKKYYVSIFIPTSVTDVKILTGEQYSNRLQLELLVKFIVSTEVETLRIDKVDYYITENN